ncbi:MAG: hypothetical protein ABIP42_00025 [Planctomycetota bacterium]
MARILAGLAIAAVLVAMAAFLFLRANPPQTAREEDRGLEPPCSWTRIGTPVRVVLDAEHPSADVELNPDQR